MYWMSSRHDLGIERMRLVLCLTEPVPVRVQSRASSSKIGSDHGSVITADARNLVVVFDPQGAPLFMQP